MKSLDNLYEQYPLAEVTHPSADILKMICRNTSPLPLRVNLCNCEYRVWCNEDLIRLEKPTCHLTLEMKFHPIPMTPKSESSSALVTFNDSSRSNTMYTYFPQCTHPLNSAEPTTSSSRLFPRILRSEEHT